MSGQPSQEQIYNHFVAVQSQTDAFAGVAHASDALEDEQLAVCTQNHTAASVPGNPPRSTRSPRRRARVRAQATAMLHQGVRHICKGPATADVVTRMPLPGREGTRS